MSLGTKLRELRQRKNWSQQEVSLKLDISQPAYNKWETDQSKPTIDNLLKISEIFEISVEELLTNISGVNISNNTFTDNSSAIYQYCPNINYNPDFFESINKNQEQITTLIETQNKLISELLKK